MMGETFYLYDTNRRRYIDRNERRVQDRSYFWVPVVVVDETARSWIARGEGREVKIDKKNHKLLGIRDFFGLDNRAYTTAEREAKMWMEENLHRLVRAVENCRDVDTLRAIDALLEK